MERRRNRTRMPVVYLSSRSGLEGGRALHMQLEGETGPVYLVFLLRSQFTLSSISLSKVTSFQQFLISTTVSN